MSAILDPEALQETEPPAPADPPDMLRLAVRYRRLLAKAGACAAVFASLVSFLLPPPTPLPRDCFRRSRVSRWRRY
jgi:hypothetical protein